MLRSMDLCSELQVEYLTKELPGYEIESKWALLNQAPVLTILKWIEDISFGAWEPYKVQKCMGRLPTEIRFFKLSFIFWGVYVDGIWRQIARAAESPWHKNHYLLDFKDEGEMFMPDFPIVTHRPLKRKELRNSNWVDCQTMVSQVRSVFPNGEIVGRMQRERCSIYITNSVSFRNFCLSADRCELQESKSVLSQVEIEYKGRNGVWFWHPDLSGVKILIEFQKLHSILENQYPGSLLPTTARKFQWIIEHLTSK